MKQVHERFDYDKHHPEDEWRAAFIAIKESRHETLITLRDQMKDLAHELWRTQPASLWIVPAWYVVHGVFVEEYELSQGLAYNAAGPLLGANFVPIPLSYRKWIKLVERKRAPRFENGYGLGARGREVILEMHARLNLPAFDADNRNCAQRRLREWT